MMNKPATNPYVGPRSFTRKEREYFFGRERESRDLLSLVLSRRLVLFYAQSGAGKTSLINTSLIPGLEENDRLVLPVGRVSGELPGGAAKVDNIFVFNLLRRLDPGHADPTTFARLGLGEFLHHFHCNDETTDATWAFIPPEEDNSALADDSLVRVLIIDQFEELLTAHLEHWEERADFFRQLAEALQEHARLTVVLTLREDYVAALDPYAPILPDRMHSRFYMERMDHRTALLAVTRPAEKEGRPFAPGSPGL